MWLLACFVRLLSAGFSLLFLVMYSWSLREEEKQKIEIKPDGSGGCGNSGKFHPVIISLLGITFVQVFQNLFQANGGVGVRRLTNLKESRD